MTELVGSEGKSLLVSPREMSCRRCDELMTEKRQARTLARRPKYDVRLCVQTWDLVSENSGYDLPFEDGVATARAPLPAAPVT
jgi:hypothetical protein